MRIVSLKGCPMISFQVLCTLRYIAKAEFFSRSSGHPWGFKVVRLYMYTKGVPCPL